MFATFLTDTSGAGATGTWWVEVLVNTLQCTGQPPTTKDELALTCRGGESCCSLSALTAVVVPLTASLPMSNVGLPVGRGLGNWFTKRARTDS